MREYGFGVYHIETIMWKEPNRAVLVYVKSLNPKPVKP